MFSFYVFILFHRHGKGLSREPWTLTRSSTRIWFYLNSTLPILLYSTFLEPQPCLCLDDRLSTLVILYMLFLGLPRALRVLFKCTFWDSVPDGSLQWSSSCLMWFPWWPDMVPWTHLRESFLRWMRTDLTSEFNWIYTFYLVIRFSIVKHSAIPFFTFLRCPAAPVVYVNLGNFTFASVKPFRTATNLFSRWCSSFWCNMQHEGCSR